MDNSKKVLNSVDYSFKVTDTSGAVLKDVHDQHASQGTGIQTVTFTKPGAANVLVSVDAVAGIPSGEFVENAKFGLLVQG